MGVFLRMSRKRLTSVAAAAILAGGLAFLPNSGRAADAQLSPQTKLRVSVLQWMPMKGAYEEWTALGGEFVVSDTGSIVLPVIGAIPVGTMDSTALANEIAKRIQAKTGLVNKPDTTVEIVEFPPIYVVGDVNKPGEYKFRSRLTVLQAIALSGGELQPGENTSRDEIQLVGNLQGLAVEMLRGEARIARLQAEMNGTATIAFPPVPAGMDGKAAAEVYAQEKTILVARANEIDRQTKSLTELSDLFSAEIGVLEEKIKATDIGIKSTETELANVKTLVEKGLAIASRQSELERALADYRAERLDQVTAIMRARQNITEATRNLEGLHDKQQTEVASQIQTEQGNLEQLAQKRDTTQKLLLDVLSRKDRTALSGEGGAELTIKRSRLGEQVTIPATESTELMSGDVVEVRLPGMQRGRDQAVAADGAASGDAQSHDASQ